MKSKSYKRPGIKVYQCLVSMLGCTYDADWERFGNEYVIRGSMDEATQSYVWFELRPKNRSHFHSLLQALGYEAILVNNQYHIVSALTLETLEQSWVLSLSRE